MRRAGATVGQIRDGDPGPQQARLPGGAPHLRHRRRGRSRLRPRRVLPERPTRSPPAARRTLLLGRHRPPTTNGSCRTTPGLTQQRSPSRPRRSGRRRRHRCPPGQQRQPRRSRRTRRRWRLQHTRGVPDDAVELDVGAAGGHDVKLLLEGVATTNVLCQVRLGLFLCYCQRAKKDEIFSESFSFFSDWPAYHLVVQGRFGGNLSLHRKQPTSQNLQS